MAWISVNRYLTQSEMENNADIIIAYYRSLNYDDKTIASILGNMQWESTLSPIITEDGGQGYGLVQWTPRTKLQLHCQRLGISPYYSGDIQLQVLDNELGKTASVNEWYTYSSSIHHYTSSGATDDMIGITGSQYKSNSMNFSLDKLTILFMAGYERPSYLPSVNHIEERKRYTRNWYSYMQGSPTPPTPPTPPVPIPPFESSGKRRGRRVVIFKKKKQYLQ